MIMHSRNKWRNDTVMTFRSAVCEQKLRRVTAWQTNVYRHISNVVPKNEANVLNKTYLKFIVVFLLWVEEPEPMKSQSEKYSKYV